MMRLSDRDMFIVDILHYDIEQVSNIVRLLNDGTFGWSDVLGRDFTDDDVIEALTKLVNESYVKVLAEGINALVEVDPQAAWLQRPDEYWFMLTAKGREMFDAWEPPA